MFNECQGKGAGFSSGLFSLDDNHTDRQKDRQIDTHIDRQIDTHIDR